MNKSSHYTLMFVPEDNGKTFTLRIHKYILRSLICFLVIFLAGLTLLLYKSGEIAAKLQLLYLIKMENERLSEDNDQLRKLSEKLVHIEELSKYLERLALPESGEGSKIVNKMPNKDSLPGPKETDALFKLYTGYSSSQGIDRFSSIPNIPPVEGWITRKFSADSGGTHTGHQGIDFAAASGTPIRATAAGVIDDIINDRYLGLMVIIRHDDSFMTKYGHCSQILVSKHERVKRGQTIALVGNTGRSTAPHLHYEVLKDGKSIDPLDYLIVHQD